MGSGFAKMKKQARAMQAEYEKVQKEKEHKSSTGTSAQGLVSITLNGLGELKNITISPHCVTPDDIEGLQDLILDAHAAAHAELQKEAVEPSSPF